MDRKKVVLVARDAAPSRAFIKLEPVLRENGFDVSLLVGDGKSIVHTDEQIVFAMVGASIVILGMSSSEELARPELLAGKMANGWGIPYGFYGDVRRCWARARTGAWFEELASDAAFYFGVTQDDAVAAREVFPNASLYGTGNPLREEMAFPLFTRESVRAKLGINPEEKLVLAPGGKFAAGNMASWAIIMDALALLGDAHRFQLILSTHPGDRTPYAVDSETHKGLNLYEELVAFSPVPTRIVGKDMLTTSDMVPGADIIVEFGSSIGIEGAYQNVPVITLGMEVLLRRLEQASGSRMLEMAVDGLSVPVDDAHCEELAYQISKLLTPVGFEEMLAQQKKLCPMPTERGAALHKMVDAIKVMTA